MPNRNTASSGSGLDWRRIVSNAFIAFAAQGVVMTLGVIQALLIPKVLGVEEFGYWQLFTFYVGYVGFFPLGLNDGVYLLNGGIDRERIDKRSVFSQMVFGASYEMALALCVAAIGLFGVFEPRRKIVIVCTAVFIVVQDNAGYLSTLFQAMDETRRSSYSLILERIAFLIPLVALLWLGINDFVPYVIAYIASSVVQLLYGLRYFRDFIYAGFAGWVEAVQDGLRSIMVGSKLMLANVSGLLVLGTMRLCIDVAWGIEAFGKLSLSLSLANFFMAFVNQASMVLFPALRRTTETEIASFFDGGRRLLSIALPLLFVAYFPLTWLVAEWLPAYVESLVYFAYLMPICVFDSKMSVLCSTYFKVTRQEGRLFRINLLTAMASSAGAALGAFVLHSVPFTIGSAVIAVMGRSLASEHMISAKLGRKIGAFEVSEIGLSVAFVAAVLCLEGPIAFCVIAMAYSIYLFAFRKDVERFVDALGSLLGR